MVQDNLFSLLSAYRPGSSATPFENYCTSGLAYFLHRKHRMLTALLLNAAGAATEDLAMVEVQPQLGDAGIADLLLTFEGGLRILIETQVESGADERHLPDLQTSVGSWSGDIAFVMLGLRADLAPEPWRGVSWLDVVEALDGDPDPMAIEFSEFVLRDILGLGEVPLEEAIRTNRLYALGGAAVRKMFGEQGRYVNSASRPIGGRYRYLGTTFAPDGEDMSFWIGLVNETVPLSEHYHLMLASKERLVAEEVAQPRATADWKWAHWTGLGRVVRPVTIGGYERLLGRLAAE